jgi:hypothetical protein
VGGADVQSKLDANLQEKVRSFSISKKLGDIDSEIGNDMLVAFRRRLSERCGATKIWCRS